MGYEARSWEAHVRLSRHNSHRDEEDARLWEDLVRELENVAAQRRYSKILMFTQGGD